MDDIDIIELRKVLEERKKEKGKAKSGKKTTKPECPGCNSCNPRIITKEELAASGMKPKEMSGAEAISPLFKSVIPKADDPCKGCDGTDCSLLEEAGITCMGIEGLEEIQLR